MFPMCFLLANDPKPRLLGGLLRWLLEPFSFFFLGGGGGLFGLFGSKRSLVECDPELPIASLKP